MSINFLLQVVRILHNGNYDDTEERMIYDYLKNLDYLTLIHYFSTNCVLQYKNDLEFCVEIIDSAIKIFEKKEEYEKCQILLNKKYESLDIMNKNKQYEKV